MARIAVRVDPPFRQQVDVARLREAARRTLAHEGVPSKAELTIMVTGDREIRELNRTYRGMDKPTDVLSFGETLDSDFVPAPGEPAYLGDVVISYPRALAQASGRHPVEHEMLLLVVHGVLHLLGHDHAVAQEKREMWAAQEQILDQLGIRVEVSEK